LASPKTSSVSASHALTVSATQRASLSVTRDGGWK
jgi:hypothetical protein